MQQIETILGGKIGQLALAVIAFLVAALLVLVIVRMLFGGKLRAPGSRARQARLGIVDAFDLDRQRQLIIIRRDNTEHLILIGGPNDLLIEPEIVRVEAREPRSRDKEPGFGDARIPAPFTPADRPELRGP
ncbi:MAG: flagellar biosynthetic protein FliO, partial [Beijerinckiaceae bacterium]|nr:flagellar biosynthetic protein FliO [Beijerinckiaceae bacterium]